MARYILRRGLMGLLTAWAVTVLAYVIIQLPLGDYISSYLAQLEASGTFAGEEEAVHLRELYGLNEPVLVQYGFVQAVQLAEMDSFFLASERPARLQLSEIAGDVVAQRQLDDDVGKDCHGPGREQPHKTPPQDVPCHVRPRMPALGFP